MAADGLLAQLARAGVVEVDSSPRRLTEYSSDASLYRVRPTAVVFPRSSYDIVATFEVCRAAGIPIAMRGGGTSIAGNAIGTGVVVDCSRHLDRIDLLDPDNRRAIVQPGVVLDSLQTAAAAFGQRFGPDPSSHSRATVGGMIGNNACGSRALRYGRTGDNVIALDVLTGTGERLTVGAEADKPDSPTLARLHALVADNLSTVRQEFGRFGRQGSGYALEHLLPENGRNVARFLAGTEGTLALTLSATVRLTPLPAAQQLVVLGYNTSAEAADDVPALLGCSPVAIEGLDSGLLDLFTTQRGFDAVPRLPLGRAWLLVEIGADESAELADAVQRVLAATQAIDSMPVEDPVAAAKLWRMREDAAGIAARPSGGKAVHAGWEDAAVPPERLGGYLREFDQLLATYRLTGYPYGHFGDGCIHVRLDFDLDTGDGVTRFRSFLSEAANLVVAHGGSLSGEHGDGRARSELLAKMYSPAALDLMSQVKAVFDPANLLNPGIIVAPARLDNALRSPDVIPLTRRLGLLYADDAGDFARAVHRCTGVGKCRALPGTGGDLMCPSYLATRDEKDSTRGRARVLQELVSGTSKPDWRSSDVHDALDLCLACKGCASDCPTGTDVAAYKIEVLHQTYRRRIRPATHYSLGRLPTWARIAATAPRLANAALRGPLSKWGLRLAGLDSRRRMPEFAAQTFTSWFGARANRGASNPPVMLWTDTFMNHFTPDVGRAAVEVLESAGYDVQIPPQPICCGLTYLSTGQLRQARKRLRASLRVIARAASDGIPVIALEPSCAAVFRSDALHLLGAEAQPGTHVQTLAEFLRRSGAKLPDLAGHTLKAQPHCHHRAVLGWDTDVSLLQDAGATVDSIAGCCGLAGNFGAERGHHDVSVAVAQTHLLPAIATMATDDVLLADGFSCRTQVGQLSGRRAVHLAELLNESPGEPT